MLVEINVTTCRFSLKSGVRGRDGTAIPCRLPCTGVASGGGYLVRASLWEQQAFMSESWRGSAFPSINIIILLAHIASQHSSWRDEKKTAVCDLGGGLSRNESERCTSHTWLTSLSCLWHRQVIVGNPISSSDSSNRNTFQLARNFTTSFPARKSRLWR